MFHKKIDCREITAKRLENDSVASSLPKEICWVIETSEARFNNPQLVKVLVADY
jgi:hypothetical protein